jgi:hypothetical protein
LRKTVTWTVRQVFTASAHARNRSQRRWCG